MKKLFFSLMMAFVCGGAMAEEDTKEYKTFVKNDYHVFYCSHNGVTVVVDPTQGGIFEPHISIINESCREFIFEPQKITASAFAIPGVSSKSARYRVERFLAKGDTLGFDKDQLKIYTPEKYIKVENKANFWATLLVGVVNGAVKVGANALRGDDNRSPEERAADRLIEDKYDDRLYQEMSNEHQQEIKRIKEQYWRANTIFDGEEHEGFIAIKPVKSQYLILDIPVNGENFHFIINNNKKY